MLIGEPVNIRGRGEKLSGALGSDVFLSNRLTQSVLSFILRTLQPNMHDSERDNIMAGIL